MGNEPLDLSMFSFLGSQKGNVCLEVVGFILVSVLITRKWFHLGLLLVSILRFGVLLGCLLVPLIEIASKRNLISIAMAEDGFFCLWKQGSSPNQHLQLDLLDGFPRYLWGLGLVLLKVENPCGCSSHIYGRTKSPVT